MSTNFEITQHVRFPDGEVAFVGEQFFVWSELVRALEAQQEQFRAFVEMYNDENPTDLNPYCVTGTGTDIPAAVTQQDLSTEQVAHSNYALATDNITVTAAGTYLISYSILVLEDGTTGGTQGRCIAYVTDDATPIPQSYSGVFVAELSGGTGLSASFIVTVGAGSVLALYTDQDGTGVPDMSLEKSSLSILKVG